jgi:hypothetical protein
MADKTYAVRMKSPRFGVQHESGLRCGISRFHLLTQTPTSRDVNTYLRLVIFSISLCMACKEHGRLEREYDSALRSWALCRFPSVVSGIPLDRVSTEERQEALFIWNAAANQL